MIRRIIPVFVFLVTSFLLVQIAVAQSADGRTPLSPSSKDKDRDGEPKSFREMMEKMRIEAEKKDYQAMLIRGDEALKLSEELEKSFELTAQLSSKDVDKLESLEKLVKKIRGELGGSDDDGTLTDVNGAITDTPKIARPNTLVEGFRILKSTTVKLVDELKKTTRFSISAAAIQSTNVVLRLTRFLRLRN